jgi:peptidoglycan/xylan/chitin deacetylase (PgdA/CDA1 family)
MKKLLWLGLALAFLCFPVFAESPEEREEPPVGYVALTFDDGPSGALTEQLLDGLRDRGARATFFLCGYRMDQYPSALDRYIAEGHEVGVHSTVHTDLTQLTAAQVHQDMEETAQKIQDALGVRPTLMRPPGGAYDDGVLKEAASEGLSVVLWSVDPRDWACHDAGTVARTMTRQAGNGDIILMHDMSESSVRAALRLVDTLQAQGYSFVTVSELAQLSGTVLEAGAAYEWFG